MATALRRNRREVFARRAAGFTITLADIRAADERDDAEDPDGALARLQSLARRLSASGTPHHVWSVPAMGYRPAEFVVLPSAYADESWSIVR